MCGSQKVQAEGGCAEVGGRGMALRLHTLDARALWVACAAAGRARAGLVLLVRKGLSMSEGPSGVESSGEAARAGARWALGECAAPDSMVCVPCAGKDAFALRGLVESLVSCTPTSSLFTRKDFFSTKDI